MISPVKNSIERLAIAFVLLLGSLLVSASTVEIAVGQAATEISPTQERYEKALARGRELAKVCRNIGVRFFDSTHAESQQWKDKWPEASKNLADHKLVLERAAVDWFMEAENPSTPLLHLVNGASHEIYKAGDYERAYRLLKKIKQFYPEKDKMLDRRLALVGIKSNHFEHGMEFIQSIGAKAAIEELEDSLDKNLFILCPLLSSNWQKESEIRKKEAEADDLPRVKLQFSTGEVIVELFENEAPQTVANFINLVESGFYDGSVGHPVIEKIVAQAGLYNRTKKAPLDYVIKNESRLENARKHFTGSLSMASAAGGVDSATSMFAITLLPNPDLDWDRTEADERCQTVFGRVIEGMDRVMALPPTVELDPETDEQKAIKDAEPGGIEKATVIRKRDHEYTFEKIKPNKLDKK